LQQFYSALPAGGQPLIQRGLNFTGL